MSTLLSSAKFSLSNAKRHIASLKSEIEAFYSEKPFKNIMSFDPCGPDDVYKVKLVKPMPEFLSGIAFDAISNLRASLDQAGYSIGIATGKTGKKCKFPFGDTLTEVNSRCNAGSKELPEEIFNLMASFKPYSDGDKYLWGLNKLCNAHKHNIITPTAIYSGGGAIDQIQFSYAKSFSFPPKWDSVKKEMILAVVPHGAATKLSMRVETFVSIGDVDGIQGVPALTFLEDVATTIEKIIDALEDKCIDLDIN